MGYRMRTTENNIVVKQPRVKHKFDKQLININVATNNNQNNTLLYTATYPSVIMGVVVVGTSLGIAGGVNFQWFLVVVEQGETPFVVAWSGSCYNPEQQVLCFGAGYSDSSAPNQFYVKTKTGRKLRAGDTVYFITASNTAVALSHTYNVQFFLKI